MFPDSARNLGELLEQIAGAARSDSTRVTVGGILDAVGTRSFAPLLMATGILLASPLSGIPLFPSTMALVVVLVSVQILLGRRHVWLPSWLLHRALQREYLLRVLDRLRKPCGVIDRFLAPRLVYLVSGPAEGFIAFICLAMAVVMPLMEVVPLSASIAGVALCAFGLALVARDGLMVLLGYALVLLMVMGAVGAMPANLA